MANTPGGVDPWGGCFPSAANTGVPDGTALTTYTGPCTITAANTVIDKKTVNCGFLNIKAAGVKITNSKVNGSVWVDTPNAGYSFTISDSTIDAGEVSASANDGKSSIGKSNFVATRVETLRGIRGVWCEYRLHRPGLVDPRSGPRRGRRGAPVGHPHGRRLGDPSTTRCPATPRTSPPTPAARPT